MAHPYHHSESSARKFGGISQDYQKIHDWFDATKCYTPLPVHRALRHHAQGIFEAEVFFGTTLKNSDGREIPVRWIGEQHVLEDCRRIPTVQDWLKGLPIESWMLNGVILSDIDDHEPVIEGWKQAVQNCKTLLGFKDWCEQSKTKKRKPL